MDVLVFKTDLTRQHLSLVAGKLSTIDGLIRWSVDLEDCDKVLRVECDDLLSGVVVEHLQQAKIFCEELQ